LRGAFLSTAAVPAAAAAVVVAASASRAAVVASRGKEPTHATHIQRRFICTILTLPTSIFAHCPSHGIGSLAEDMLHRSTGDGDGDGDDVEVRSALSDTSSVPGGNDDGNDDEDSSSRCVLLTPPSHPSQFPTHKCIVMYCSVVKVS
jgi:hypothetical protein